MKRMLSALGAAGLATLLAAFGGPAWSAFPGKATETIAFVQVSGKNSGTYVARTDGTGVRRVSSSWLAWSPDGRRVAGGISVGKRCIFAAVELATGRGTNLRAPCGGYRLPAWSRDGRRIAYSAGRKIFLVSSAGTAPPQRITNGLNDQSPGWSPDGKALLFDMLVPSGSGNARQIWRMTPEGAGAAAFVPLTHPLDGNWGADWSPDGRKVAFAAKRDEWVGFETGEIYVMDAQSGEVTRMTSRPGLDESPRWSPDGSKILFAHGSGPRGEIWVMNADGTDQRLVAKGGMMPQWVPSGARTTFPAVLRLR